MGDQTRSLENLAVNALFWRGKRVLVTGHTGFKGSWLSLWLQKLGAQVTGYALPPPSEECLFKLACVGQQMQSVYGDVRHLESLRALFDISRPEVVFHLAAQPLVRLSYLTPVETYEANVMGTVHVLESVRGTPSCRVLVNVTSDKCYENNEWAWGYRECDPMGGHDPYSSSKGCAELITAAYRHSFFESTDAKQGIGLATARAGNVIGGGDFSKDRLIPDFMAAIVSGKPLLVRNPNAVRPWQHVLEPLSGYLLLAERLWSHPAEYAESWNFGPDAAELRPVRWIVEKLSDCWDKRVSWQIDTEQSPHEAQLLLLDSSKARMKLGWAPRWSLDRALRAVTEWHTAHFQGDPIREVVVRQIESYESWADEGASQRLSTSYHDFLQPRHDSTQ